MPTTARMGHADGTPRCPRGKRRAVGGCVRKRAGTEAFGVRLRAAPRRVSMRLPTTGSATSHTTSAAHSPPRIVRAQQGAAQTVPHRSRRPRVESLLLALARLAPKLVSLWSQKVHAHGRGESRDGRGALGERKQPLVELRHDTRAQLVEQRLQRRLLARAEVLNRITQLQGAALNLAAAAAAAAAGCC